MIRFFVMKLLYFVFTQMRVQPESLYSAPFTEQVDSIDSQELKTNKKIGRTCISEGCSTQASFRFPNEKDNVYCAKHKLSGMIDYRSRKCEHPDCTTIASFNFFGLKKRRFCKLHAEPGMLVAFRTYRHSIQFNLCSYIVCTAQNSSTPF